MIRHRSRRNFRPDRESGQAMVLGVLSMLILALTLMMSFNLNQAIHEKIRIQQHSDAMAYSKAVAQARAFNYFAYSNRAIAATYVSMVSLHAYMASAASVPGMMWTNFMNFLIIAAQEFAKCCSCGAPWPCCKLHHCWHGIQAIIKAFEYLGHASDYESAVQALEDSFNDAIASGVFMIEMLHTSQNMYLGQTVQLLMGEGDMEQLIETNAPETASSTWPGLVAAGLSVNEFMCAIDGMPCFGGDDSPDDIDIDDKRRLMTEVVNATRGHQGHGRPNSNFITWRQGIPFPMHINWDVHDLLMDDDSYAVPHSGTAKLIDGANDSALHDGSSGHTGDTMGACDTGIVINTFQCGVSALGYGGYIFSNADGGDHGFRWLFLIPMGLGGTFDSFEGVHEPDDLFGCTILGNCFMKFRANPSREANFGQPATYYASIQNLHDDGEPGERAWELNEAARIEFHHGEHDPGELELTSEGDGTAISKGLVYYHRLGDWREHPNFFNPYWRAKLHPFEEDEARNLLLALGQLDKAGLAEFGIPLP